MQAFFQILKSKNDIYYKENSSDQVNTAAYVNSLTRFFISSVGTSDGSKKLDYFKKSILDNIFINKETRDAYLSLFCESQRAYHALACFANRYRFKTAKIQIDHDLYLNPITGSQRNVMTIFQENNKYLFTLNDLTNLIETALSNSPNFFAEPLPIKNPYNNIPFSKAILYNIYFFYRRGGHIIPEIYYKYFLSNFNLKTFNDENSVLIRKIYIKKYLKNLNPSTLRKDVNTIFESNKYSKGLKITSKFPTNKLVDIMRPYLLLYYNSMYTLDMNERHTSYNLLNNKLKKFVESNPNFGRVYYKLETNKIQTYTYNDQHIPFSTNEDYYKNYDKSHLEIISNEDDNEYGENVDEDSSDDDLNDTIENEQAIMNEFAALLRDNIIRDTIE